MNSVFLFDHLYVPSSRVPSGWSAALLSLGVPVKNLSDDNQPPSQHIAYSPGNIIFCHTTGQGKWKGLVQNGTIKGHLIFVRSDGGQTPGTDADRIHWCYWKPIDFSSCPNNESVRRFILGLQQGVILNEFLQPRAVPNALIAYALAVQYQLNIPNINELCAAADSCYEKLQPYAKSLFDKNRAVSFPNNDVPEIHKFEPAPGSTNGVRFKAVRNVIDLLREDS